MVSALSSKNSSYALSESAPIKLPSVAASLDDTTFQPVCLGITYGYDLSAESCADALLLINSSSTAVQTYGVRGTGLGHFDVMLPRRYISSEC